VPWYGALKPVLRQVGVRPGVSCSLRPLKGGRSAIRRRSRCSQS